MLSQGFLEEENSEEGSEHGEGGNLTFKETRIEMSSSIIKWPERQLRDETREKTPKGGFCEAA